MLNMDLGALANQATSALAPFLPYLAPVGTKLTEEASQALAGEGGQLAKALWAKLRPQVESKGAAQEAAQDVATTPTDEEARITLKRQLTKLFETDPDLARAVA